MSERERSASLFIYLSTHGRRCKWSGSAPSARRWPAARPPPAEPANAPPPRSRTGHGSVTDRSRSWSWSRTVAVILSRRPPLGPELRAAPGREGDAGTAPRLASVPWPRRVSLPRFGLSVPLSLPAERRGRSAGVLEMRNSRRCTSAVCLLAVCLLLYLEVRISNTPAARPLRASFPCPGR